MLATTKILHRGINLYLVSYGQTYPGIPKFEGGFSGIGERENAKVNLEFEIETLQTKRNELKSFLCFPNATSHSNRKNHLSAI